MRRLLNGLVFRIAALFLLGALVLQAAIVAAVLWPDDRPMAFRLVDPAEVLEIVRALEAVAPDQRDAVIAAVNNGAVAVRLLPAFPADGPQEPGLLSGAGVESRLIRSTGAFGGRRFRVETSDSGPTGDALQAPFMLFVELRTGQALAIAREPVILRTIASRYMAIAAVVVAVLLAILLILTWQVVRPVSRLVAATHALREDIAAPDVIAAGASELKELAVAFNAMKHRIGGLVADRTRALAAIAHDLRTYLTRLRLRADFIEDAEQRAKAIHDLTEMEQLLDDVLLFARDDVRNEQPIPVIDIRSEVEDYIRLRREVGEPVALLAGHGPLLCRCPPLAFRRMLGNLIDNAIRYGKSARVELGEADGVLLTVDDDGPGIPFALAERLAQPFERLEPSRGRRTGGAGLGLAIVKALAESNGGSLMLENRAGGGLRASLRLPNA
ncbi:ATP-binding protein [Devosia sp. XK-2]|uniref:ATP-binding protein n=1 Tax=Devosia sp. XK-2 TaxID=3126689 RepID=UPI0030CF0372